MKLYRKKVELGEYHLPATTRIASPIGLPLFILFPNPANGEWLQSHLGHIQFEHRTQQGELYLKFDISNPNLGKNFKAAIVEHLDRFSLHFSAVQPPDFIVDDSGGIQHITFTGFILHEHPKND